MAVNTLKIRLGAADQQTLYAGTTNALDLGASVGGVELNYNPTIFQVEIDQSPMPVAAFRVKEEVSYDVALVQIQMALFAASIGYGSSSSSGVTTTATGSLVAPTGGAATPVGTPASTTYTYTWVAFCSTGDSIPGTPITTATGPVTLGAVNYVSITPPTAVPGAVGYKLVRTVGGVTQGVIATFYGIPPTVSDTGLTATAYTAVIAAPTYPNSDQAFFGGTVFVPTGSFDFAIPKNDGTKNHLRGHLAKVFSSKATKLDGKRDKQSEMSKLSLTCLADLTQAVGQQGGYLVEEF